MGLSRGRIVFQGETPYAHEREAIEYVCQGLPDVDPYHVWALVELQEPSTGRLYEIDLLVLGYSAIYLVEIKSGPGKYEGDHQDWYRTEPGDRARYMENPKSFANLKAKVLSSRLKTKMREPAKCPWVESLVFLSHKDTELSLQPSGRFGVVTRASVLKALQFHQFDGAPPNWRGDRVAKPQMQDIAQALQALGLRPRKGKAHVGAYELGELLEDGPGYQDRLAIHRDQRGWQRRARVYLVPQQTSVERRQQLRRAADREAQLLYDVREHPNVLRVEDYVTDAPLGPTVLFDRFDGGEPLDAFIRKNATLKLEDKVAIIEQVGRALAYCHRRNVIHGALAPQCVLVRRHSETNALETRLFNFQLGAGTDVDVTTHWSALAADAWSVYQAPELRENPLARTPASDVFSLGALSYYVLTGRAPGETSGDVDRRLASERHLDPRVVDDGIRPKIADLVCEATAASPIARIDSASDWVELLLLEATEPEPKATDVDPLLARADDILGSGDRELIVEGVLGKGATARVLQVARRDGRSYALKVAADPAHDDRLLDEAETLAKVNDPRIVQLGPPVGPSTDPHKLGGRVCLLLTLAGSTTLQRQLAELGPVSLDQASRYGDDLLHAVQWLEEHQILHRDIKPANLGVGSVQKLADHLTLFDFSLARLPAKEIQVGTAVYRDPYLRLRGAWDFAAERWSAAITLHEMLTGSRPTVEGGSAIDADAKIRLAAERFDASVRDQLVEFFEKAFARDASARHASAEEMRHAWIAIVGAPARAARKAKAAPAPDTQQTTRATDDQIRAIEDATPIEALPISVRARNALDRAGLARARDLLGLADNRLSVIRGIGSAVKLEILDLRNRWAAFRGTQTVAFTPFFAAYRGEDQLVDRAGLDAAIATLLRDAGLSTLSAVASAPAEHIETLASKHSFASDVLRIVLTRENDRADQRVHPSTLEGWLDALVPAGEQRHRFARLLYGLDAPFEGRHDTTVREVAQHCEKTTAAIYIALGKARDEWAKHPALDELRRRCRECVDACGGAVPVTRAADVLRTALAHERGADEATSRARAAALFRIVCEVDKESEHAMRCIRLHDRDPWLFASDEHARVTRLLGAAADDLAGRTVIASAGEAKRVFGEITATTPLAALREERLVELAAEASERGACSARLEIYPRGLEPRRAIELSATTFKGGVTPADIAARVANRYPLAAPLPPRPELDALLAPLGLKWNADAGRYLRDGEEATTTLQTHMSSLGRIATALPTQARAMDSDAIDARQFDERLRSAIERRSFRVIGVTADRAREAALAIGERLGVQPTSLDALLIEEIARQMKAGGIARDDIVHAADRAGPNGEHWPRLMKLVNAAADALEHRLLPPKEPLLLVQPGLLARYRLESLTRALVEAGRAGECAAIFLVVADHDRSGLPRINGEMAIPGLLSSQALWMSRAWLANKHNAAA